MLRAMLADRFKLSLHVENRDEPVYDVVLTRSDGRLGAGMSPTEIDCAAQIAASRAAAEAAFAAGTPTATRPPFDRNAPAPRCALRVVYDRMEGDTTMANLALASRPYTGRHVVDKTGLTGFYKVTMVFAPLSARRGPDTTASDPHAPASIFTAVQEQFGLKLQSSHASGSRLVIDRLERPTPD
jgi:uncharacterized protein (TIGR03435 family)